MQHVRQIGNAVPVPLGLALGKSLGKMLVQAWYDAQEEVEEIEPVNGMSNSEH
jgi:hypothetical protein